MTDRAVVKIFRFDPEVDKRPKYETYEVPPEAWRGCKLIDTLRYIYENFAPGLSFREPCRQKLCGACIMLLNKKPVFACASFSQKEMVLDPLPKYPIIKDLVVDFSAGKKS